MNNSTPSKLLALSLALGVGLMPMHATAEDIDIFTGASAGAKANPNILIVIDNTSNWSRQSQQWPGGIAQGQSEANAIKTVINALGANGANVNLGLMEFVTNGNANDQGGFIRYAIRPMDPATTNVSDFSTKLNTIYTNISSPNEKRSANTPYGDLMYDVYNYYAGTGVSNDGTNLCAGLNPPSYDTDAGGYTINYSQFKSPASATASCARNFVIFIGNPNTNGPASDSTANSCELYKLVNGTTTCPAGNFSPQLGLPNLGLTGNPVSTTIGQTAQCYTSAQAGTFNTNLDTCVASGAASCYSSTVDTNYLTATSTANSSVTGCSPYTQDCSLGALATNNYPMACGAGTQSYNVLQTGTTTTGPTAGTTSQNTSTGPSACYATSTAANTAISASSNPDSASMKCPIPTYPGSGVTNILTSQDVFTGSVKYDTISGSTTTTTTITNSCSYSPGSLYAKCSTVTGNQSTATGNTTTYTNPAPTISNVDNTTGSTAVSVANTTLSCPAYSSCTYSVGSVFATQYNSSYTSTYTTTGKQSSVPTAPATFVNNTGSAVNVAFAGVATAFSCPAYSTCTYSTVSTVNSAPTTTYTTGYLAAAPTAPATDDNSSGSSAHTTTWNGLTLSCPAYSICTYGAVSTAVSGGTSTSTVYTTGLLSQSTAPAAPSTINNSSGSSAATSTWNGTTLSCPAYSSCTYGTVTQTGSGGTTAPGYTTAQSSSAPTIANIDNSQGSSGASRSGTATTKGGATALSCPAHTYCTYTVGSAVTTIGSTSTALTYDCYAAAPATSTVVNNTATPKAYTLSEFTSSSPGWIAGQSINPDTMQSALSCPAYSTCDYTNAAQAATVKDGLNRTCGASNSTSSVASAVYLITQKITNSIYNVTQNQNYIYSVVQTAALDNTYEVVQTATADTEYAVTQTAQGTAYEFNVTQTATLSPYTYYVVQTVKPSTTTVANSVTSLGQSSKCYASAPTYVWSGTSDYTSQCTGSGVTCAYGTTKASTTDYCGVGTYQYTVQGVDLIQTLSANGTFTTDTAVYNADEWAKLLFQKGVPVTGGSNQTVATYTIDVYNKQPNNTETSLYMSMAKNGGGKYYAATNESAIAAALNKILAEIQSVNSTFASASLPVNSTNRAQNANQVFIGMFRPDPGAAPRWFGNLKQYQIGTNTTTGTIDLYDNATPSKPAINSQTGFLDDCAQSFWTKDSPTVATAALPWANNVYFPSLDAFYWNNINYLATSPASKCVTASSYSTSLYSDIADGAFVEKGAAAEVLRKGNDPSASSPTWSFNRDMYTLDSSNNLVTYASTNSGLSTDAFHFTQGKDVDGDCSATTTPCAHTALSNWTTSTNIMRASVHGDVVHSRPLPINYGTSSNANAGVTAYYGANDGTFRAVVATGSNAGKELWAFTAPEFSKSIASRTPSSGTDPLTRLMNNSPLVNYANVSASLSPTPIPKDYFFDGSTGVYQNIDNTKVWIYPSMRRGGRMIYGFDATNSNPSISTTQPVAFKWRVGCPDLTDDTGCTAGMSGIGQTWSTPTPVLADGFSSTVPLIVVGGGYDACEDADTSSPSCAAGKGHVVYVLNADTGAIIRTFTTLRSVIADVSFIDIDNDTFVDYGYVLDTGGNLYRINFTDPTNSQAPLSSANWSIQRIAFTNSGGRKLQWTQGLLPSSGKVYVAFGSGDREHPLLTNYPYSSNPTVTPQAGIINRLYVYMDDMTYSAANNIADGTDLDDTDVMSDFSSLTSCTTPGIGSPSNPNKGWFMNFPGRGEQAVTSAIIAGGMVTVSTNRPIPPASGTCSTALGEARGYWVNLYNASGAMNVAGNCGGDRSGIFAGGGLPPSPVIGTVPIDGVPTTVLIGAIQREGGASSPIAPQKLRPTIPSVRKPHYWKNSLDN